MSNKDDDSSEARSRLYVQVDRIEDHIGSIDTTLAKNTTLLEEHIRRTNILEAELKPVKEHVATVRAGLTWLKVITITSGALAAIVGVLKVLIP